ncbi:MAG: D-2-hydroxyacid dehydrogenase [Verrucomicrobia bacterium]|nr:D-2-hydroxyacid dehydrogenase [Verrucomicrobiota bacterium]
MKIAVLDGHTLNPGDLSWAPLEALGKCRIYERTAPTDTVARALGAAIVLTNKTVLDAASLAALPDLRYIGVLATGTNVVDLAAAHARGIPVTNVPGYSTPSVVQLTFALLLELTHHVGRHADGVRAGRWSRSPDFCYWETPLLELAGCSFGCIGFGHVGRDVARVASAFGCSVLVHTRTPPIPAPAGLEFVDLETLFRASDVVSLHCPLTDATRHLVNTERLAWMKPSAFLLNTGRGPLVDETALAAALNDGRLAGAGLDVLSVEPPPATHPLLTARNCFITPHLGWATRAARERLLAQAVDNVRAFLAGRPQNVVN